MSALAFSSSVFLRAEISKVRASLFQINGVRKEPLTLPDAEGAPVTLNEKVYVPVKEHPDVSCIQTIACSPFSLVRVYRVSYLFDVLLLIIGHSSEVFLVSADVLATYSIYERDVPTCVRYEVRLWVGLPFRRDNAHTRALTPMSKRCTVVCTSPLISSSEERHISAHIVRAIDLWSSYARCTF